MQYPVKTPFIITTEFGVPDPRAAFGRHAGIDFLEDSGQPIYAPVTGRVTDYTWGQYHGNVIQIFDEDSKLYHRLMHNSRLIVLPGTQVVEGQLVAISGATGEGITGPHCHWDISPSKVPKSFDFVDPNQLIKEEAMPKVTTPTIETLRIVHAFVSGWNIEKSLNGEYDDKFKDAAGWKDVNVFVYEQFAANGAYRDRLKKLLAGQTPAAQVTINGQEYVPKQ